jgi:tetratricopeptide (TPR) repeat protein
MVTLAIGLSGCQVLEDASQTPMVTGPRAAEPTELQRQALDRATAAKNAGQLDEALRLLQEILAENPTIAPAYLGIGDIHMARQDYGKAEPAYRRAARLSPRNFEAQYGHGLALHMLNRYEEAVRSLHRALTIRPESVGANLSMATTYLSMQDARSALLFAQKAVELDPGNGAARTNLGVIYELLGRNEESIDQFITAMELMPPSPPLMMNLINVLARERRYREVINTAENLLKLEPSANAFERMAYAHFRLAEYDRSIDAYRAAVEIDPNHWQALNGIGVNAINQWLLSKKRDTTAALEARGAFRRSLQINSDQEKVIALLSQYQL